MHVGRMDRKDDMKKATWSNSYEKKKDENGLKTGCQGNAQIGKGMWAMHDKMAAMVEQKVGHVKAGANTAWVASLTAGTLHAIHYHQIYFRKVQDEILKNSMNVNYEGDILEIPIESNPTWTKDEIQDELDNNAQTMLGYVV